MHLQALLCSLAALSGGTDLDTPDPRRLELSLDEAVLMARGSATALQLATLDRTAAREAVMAEAAAFDPAFYMDTSAGNRKTPNSFFASSGLGALDQESRSFNYQTGIREATTFGGSFSVGFDYSRWRTIGTSFFGGPSDSVSHDYGFAASFTQPLLRGGGRTAGLSALRTAQHQRDQTQAAGRDTTSATILLVHEAYWGLVAARQQLEVARVSLGRADRLREVNLAKLEQGLIAEVELLQAETDVATRQEQVSAASKGIADAQDVLLRLITDPGDYQSWDGQVVPTTEPAAGEPVPVPNWREAAQVAFGQRPDLERLHSELAERENDLAVSLNAGRMKLDLTSSVGSGSALPGSAGPEETFRFDFPEFSVAINLEVPLGNRAASARTRAAHSQVARARRALDDGRAQSIQEVKAAVRDLAYLVQRREATDLAVRLAERQLAGEERKYQVGLSTNFEVLALQEDLAAAESNRVAAVTDYAQALAQLRHVQGTLDRT